LPPNVNLTAAGVYSLGVASIAPSEGDGRAVIGGVVTYAVVVNIPITGAKQAVLNVNIPSAAGGLALVSNQSTGKLSVSLAAVSPALTTDISGGFSAAVAQASAGVGAAGTPSGQVLSVNLGDVTNSSKDQGAAQTLTIDVPTVVLDNNTGPNSASAPGVNSNGSTLAVTASLTSLLNGASTTSPVQSTTIGVANPSPTMGWTPSPGANATITVVLGIYQPQIELPPGFTCTTATETGGPSGVGCFPGSGQVTFDQPLLSGPSVITVTVTGPPSGPMCPSVEWLSSNPTNQSLSGNLTYVSYAWPRSGPDDDQRPKNERVTGEGNKMTLTSCPTG
jgi:hypothetical protein